jgi:hypothetical protein
VRRIIDLTPFLALLQFKSNDFIFGAEFVFEVDKEKSVVKGLKILIIGGNLSNKQPQPKLTTFENLFNTI